MTLPNYWPTVLIVDDDPQQGILANQMVLQVWPTADIHYVTGGEDAVLKAAALRPDLVLTDVRMPGTTGIEVCRRIKQDPFLARHTKVIAMSGYDDPRQRAEAITFGVDAILVKPIEADTWRRSLTKVLPPPGLQKKQGWSWEG